MSDANRTALAYARESSFNVCIPAIPAAGVLGTTNVYAMRHNKATLKHVKTTVNSDEINSDRMMKDLIKVGIGATGNTDHELVAQDFDDLMSAAMQADDYLAVSTSCNVAGQTLTAAAGNPFTPLIGAKFLTIANAVTAGNNGVKTVVSITGNVITLAPGSLSGADAADVMDFYVNYVTAIDGVTVTVAGQVMTATVGNFSAATQGARYVKIGLAATVGNNGIKKVVSCTNTVLTLAAGSLSGADAADVITVQCCYVRAGTTLVTHVIQQAFLADPVHWITYTGQAVDTAEIKMDAKAKVMLAFTYIGYQGLSRTQAINTAAAIAASTNAPTNTTDNVGSVLENGSAIVNPVKAISIKINNQLRQRPAIGNAATLKFGSGWSEISGSLNVYFTDKDLLEKFLAHTAIALEFPITDAAGNVQNFYMPKVQFSGDTPDVTGINTDVMQTMPYQALKDATLGYHLQIDRLAA